MTNYSFIIEKKNKTKKIDLDQKKFIKKKKKKISLSYYDKIKKFYFITLLSQRKFYLRKINR